MYNRNKQWLLNSSVLVGICLSQFAMAADYKVDSAHSNVDFTIRHIVSKVKGEFTSFDGQISFDPKSPKDAKIKATIKVDSINTNQKKRDEHLKSGDFFDAKKYPTITFVSTEVAPDGDQKYKMTGDLTIKGITKPATFDVEYLGEGTDPMGGTKAGFTATTTIKRADYGVNWNKTLDKGGLVLGEEVTINLNIEGNQEKTKK